MATYTPNYGLHQWVPEDQFLRTDFNEDFKKIDTALKGVDNTATERLTALGHDMYNLMLQNHYDGKVTGWKKSLVFDGFQNQSMIDSISPSLLRLDGVVGLCRNSQGDIDMGYGEEATFINGLNYRTAGPFKSQGYGTLSGLTIRTGNAYGQSSTSNCTFSIYLNNKQVYITQIDVTYAGTNPIQKLTFPGVKLSPGDTFSLRLNPGSSVHLLYGPEIEGTTGNLGGIVHINPAAGESGTITTPALTLPDRAMLRAWVRFQGGTVSLSAGSGKEVLPFTVLGEQSTINADGTTCIEREFSLETLPESGSLIFTLDLDLEGGQQMEVFDYGILIL